MAREFINPYSTQISLGMLLLRIFIGFRLIYGVIDNVFSMEHMKEFEGFLAQFNFPYPLISAYVSVYAQLIGGLMLLVGFKTKWAAILIVLNFLIALFMVHLPSGDNIEVMTPALAMLIIALALFFTGAGKFSLDRK